MTPAGLVTKVLAHFRNRRPPTLSPYAASLRALGELQRQDRHTS
jgi:hypothetical protein